MTGGSVTMYFDCVGYALGTASAYGGFEQSNFTLAQVWIKCPCARFVFLSVRAFPSVFEMKKGRDS